MDPKLRTLERRTAMDSTPENRTELLQSMIRSARGQVLWWPTQEAPHPAAARIGFQSSFSNEVTGQEGHHLLTGWGVAVPSVSDLIELAQTHRQGTLIDLETGRWARVLGTPHGPTVGRVAVEAQTVDALGRARSAGTPTGLQQRTVRPHEFGRFEQLQAWATPASWSAGWGPPAWRWRSEPLFDTVVLRGIEVAAFVNYAHFGDPVQGAQVKAWGVHTNLSGSYGAMPQGWYAHVNGVSVELLNERMEPLGPVDAVTYASEAMLSFELQQTTLSAIPLPHCVVPDAGRVDQASLTVPIQGAPVFPFSFPVAMPAQQSFQVRLRNPRGWREELPHGGRALARVLLHAHVAKGIVE